MRAIFFDADEARAAVARLGTMGFTAQVERERLAGEDDEEGHPWAVVSDAPDFVLELVVEEYDGWLDVEPDSAPDSPPARPLDLPAAPRMIKRPPRG